MSGLIDARPPRRGTMRKDRSTLDTDFVMWVLVLEALLALALLIFIVWWTMSGSRAQRGRDDEPRS